MNKKSKIFLITSFFLITSLISINLVLLSNSKDKNKNKLSNIDENITSVKKKTQIAIATAEKEILESKKSNSSNKESDLNNKNFKELFSSTVIMGDSQSQGLDIYDILNPTSVIAVKGGNITKANSNNISTLKNLYPTNIFTLYGMNDMLIYKDDIDSFVKDYSSLIKNIQKELPEANIFVNCIMPVSDKVTKSNPIYKDIDNYNLELEKMCKDLNITFINPSSILTDNPDLLEADGMHFKPLFYKYWLDFLQEYL